MTQQSLFVAKDVLSVDGGTNDAVYLDILTASVNYALVAIGDRRDMRILTLRLGLKDGCKRTLEAVGDELGITRERVRQIQREAMTRLRLYAQTYPYLISHCIKTLRDWGELVGASLQDAGFSRALAAMTGGDEGLISAHVRLLRELLPEANDNRQPLDAIDLQIAQVFAQSVSPVSLDQLNWMIRSNSKTRHTIEDWPKLDLSLRLELLLGVNIDANGACTATEKTFSGLGSTDRRLLALSGVIREAGKPLHFTEIAKCAKPLLPGKLAMSERNVHSWMDRYKDRFKWAGRGTFGLAEWNIGVREDDLDSGLKPARRTGVGNEIALLLSERGEPVAMDEIEDHILRSRGFEVKSSSVSASVAQDKARRFAILKDGRIALSEWQGYEDSAPTYEEASRPAPGANRRVRLTREMRDAARASARRRAEELKTLVARGISGIPPDKAAGYAILARELGLTDEFPILLDVAERNGMPTGLADALKEHPK